MADETSNKNGAYFILRPERKTTPLGPPLEDAAENAAVSGAT
jgi:hypothetical protein